MRQKVNAERLNQFMTALASNIRSPARVYLVGGATAVLFNWRESTIDIDLKIVPENDEILRRIPSLKEQLQLNIEFAAPDDFIPALPGWQERSRFIKKEGAIEFFHYDFYAQALSKIERGHTTDQLDVQKMIQHGLVEQTRLLEFFSTIQDRLYKYPAIDEKTYREAVEHVARDR